MRKLSWVVVIASIAAALSVIAYACREIPHVVPEVSEKHLGGHWKTKTTRSPAGSVGGQTALMRITAGRQDVVAPIVFKETYVGDNCVVYGTPGKCWITCGSGSPYLIVDQCHTWVVEGGQFQQLDPDGITARIVELKQKALAAR